MEGVKKEGEEKRRGRVKRSKSGKERSERGREG